VVLKITFRQPWLLKSSLAPIVALATTLVLSALGMHGLASGANALQSALHSANSAHQLETIAAGTQGINGELYHILTLHGAQAKEVERAGALRALLNETDRLAGLLRSWRDKYATAEQRPQVGALVVSLEQYKGAVAFVSAMLDVDFVAAVSFARPFDRIFNDLMQSLDGLVQATQAREREDADEALAVTAATMQAFEGVVAACVLLALLAAIDTGWAAIRSHRLSRQNSLLAQLAHIDALTGLGNRRYFGETLDSAWTACHASRSPLALVMFDIDHFKKFNDSQGHQAGDECLRQVADAAASSTRDVTDKVARYGGEEFAVILPGSSLQTARAVAERIRQAIGARVIPHPAAGPPGYVTVSLGVASLLPTEAASPALLIEAADRGLYAAKRAGRNCVGEVGQEARSRQKIDAITDA
jgi:diguanylate cyclase (GGDEF)-like protein